MVEVKVLGPGCPKCKKLFEDTQQATAEAGVMVNLIKVDQMQEIMAHGVMLTPALVIAGQVKCSGKVPTIPEIVQWLRDATDD